MPHTFNKLRTEYPEFIYEGYETSYGENGFEVIYRYNITGLSDFHTRWVFPYAYDEYTDVLDEFVFSLGMAEAISYYKCVCPRKVIVKCGMLSPKQISWWRKLFYKGLGEFQFVNGIEISEEELLTIECGVYDEEMPTRSLPLHDERTYEGVMVPIGGGKDSVVSLELLRDIPIYTYSINKNETIKNVIECCDHAAGDLAAKRILDKRIIEMNERGFLNGHIPFSSVVAFSCVICAYLNGIRHIALSNESSANESTVRDSFVNHQYSKTFEFESDFVNYINGLTDSDIHYFSLLRPYTELKIAQMFSRFKAYHAAFRSCNRGSKQGIWCCNCPKCLFVYIILSPFLDKEELISIFGEDLLEKESLDKDFRELCGLSENKPFECVGTRREVRAALKKYGSSLLTDRYRAEIDAWNDDPGEILADISDEHNIPEELIYTLNENRNT